MSNQFYASVLGGLSALSASFSLYSILTAVNIKAIYLHSLLQENTQDSIDMAIETVDNLGGNYLFMGTVTAAIAGLSGGAALYAAFRRDKDQK